MPSFPSGLPLPLLTSYADETDIGVSAVRFERGNARQRRAVARPSHSFSMSFVLTTAQFWTWQSWANLYGYDWHMMDLVSPFAGIANNAAVPIPHQVRYTSNISYEAVGVGVIRATVTAELDSTTSPVGVGTNTGDRIIAGTPAAPSNANRVIAGTPAAPSADRVIAGTPATYA